MVRHIKARGKRKARRPWSKTPQKNEGLKGRNAQQVLRPFQGWAPKFFSLACDFLCKRVWILIFELIAET